MQSFLYISPAESQSAKGGGPEDDPRFPRGGLRAQGYLSVAFGFALGLTFLAFLGILQIIEAPSAFAAFAGSDPLQTFIFGFIAGTLFSLVYNILVVRRLNLFGLESASD